MKNFPTSSHKRLFPLLSLLLALDLTGAGAQQTITYTNGEDHTAGIAITPGTNPTTLTVTSGNATQSGVISDSGVAGAVKIEGAGTLTLTGENTYTGDTSLTNGSLVVDGGSIYTANPTAPSRLLLGSDSNTSSTVTFQNGARGLGGTAASDIQIGYFSRTTAAVFVTGAGSSLGNANSTLTIGNNGSGALVVSDGGTVRASMSRGYEMFPAVVIGNTSLAPTSSLTVTGAGSTFTVGHDLFVGGSGTGEVLVANGGTITASGRVDVAPDSRFDVDGAGSTLNAFNLSVGSSTLTVRNGGNVQAPSATISLSGGSSFGSGATGYINVGAAEGSAAVAPGTITALAIDGYNNQGVLNFNHTSSAYTFSPKLTGDLVVHQNAGTTILTGASTYTGATVINGGTLVMNGSVVNSPTTVHNGALLTGTGMAGGTVTVQNGGAITPGYGAVGTLTVGSLILNGGSILNYELDTPGVTGGGVNDLIKINSNLTLDGVLNLTRLSNFGLGSYTIMTYEGSLTNHGLVLGDINPGYALSLDTATTGQVILHVGVDNILYWNGEATTGDGTVHGGNGTWDSTTTNWTYHSGSGQRDWNTETAVFAGTAGTVNVNATQVVQEMQFATTGYTVTGGTLDIGNAGASVLVDSGVSATIASTISGNGVLTKTGAGTLILTGSNDYRAGTTINAGTVSISADTNLGNSLSSLTINSGTLAITGDITSIRSINLEGSATFDVASGKTYTSNGLVSGTGNFRKEGTGTFAFNSTPSYSGGTTVNAGTVSTGNRSLTTTFLAGNGGTLAMGSGLLTVNQESDTTFAGAITGSGGLTKSGTGDLKLSGVNTTNGPTTISQGSLTLGAANAISQDSQITLAGGTFDLNGLSPEAFSQALKINGEGSTLSFGLHHTGGVTLQFANSSGELWAFDLTLLDFTVGQDELGFGTDATGLTPAQLAEINLTGYTATGLDTNGFVQFQPTVVPEPTVTLLIPLSFAALLYSFWRRRNCKLQ